MQYASNGMDITKIKGFPVSGIFRGPQDVATLALRAALLNYYSTYETIGRQLHVLVDDPETVSGELAHNLRYVSSSMQSVLFFHHFVELVMKQALRREHELLATVADRDPKTLLRLLRGDQPPPEELANVRTIEFGDALKRIRVLASEKPELEVFKGSYAVFEKLNAFRNRIWHRGQLVLRYEELDALFGKHLLPLLDQLINAHGDMKSTWDWRPPPLHCGIDPLVEIVAECHKESFDLAKVALLKEFGRAAYRNPLKVLKGRLKAVVEDYNREIERIASAAAEADRYASEIRDCPVCGGRTLVAHDDMEEYDDPETGKTDLMRYVWRVRCYNCSFELDNHTPNPKEFGFGIADFW